MQNTLSVSQIAPKRLEYVDLLKGFAIFLMVMGHFLSWQWGGALVSAPHSNHVTIVRDFIYSFHMPLFFFLSGYVFNMSMKSWKMLDLYNAIYKRFMQLIIPGLTAMAICYYVYDRIYFEWFLRTLFEIYIINAVIYYVSQRYNHNWWFETFLQVLAYIFCCGIARLVHGSVWDDVFQLHTVANKMPFFYIGTLCLRAKFLNILNRHSWIVGLALIYWVVSFVLSQNGICFHDKGYTTSISAIIVCLHIASYSEVIFKNKYVLFLCELGKYTLPVYLLSPYFIPRGFIMGKWIEYFSSDGYETAMFFQLFLGTIISSIICYLVYIISKVLDTNSVTKLLFLGKTTG